MDIVERLREAYESINHHASWSLIRDSADEIERLREALRDIVDAYEYGVVTEIQITEARKALGEKE